MTKTIKCKDLCLSDFGIQRVVNENHSAYDASRGKQQTNIGVLLSGHGKVSSVFDTVAIGTGEVIFIPEGTRYRSSYEGAPDVIYYCVHISFRKEKNGLGLDQRFRLQKLCSPNAGEAVALFPALFKLLEAGNNADRFEALARFYRFFAEALPYLSPADKPACSPAVARALAFIEEHYCEDYTTADLARECLISESRLYHLFRDELHTTPVDYKNEMKIIASIDMIKSGYMPVEEIAGRLGFCSAAYFRRLFKENTGMTPTEYRKRYDSL